MLPTAFQFSGQRFEWNGSTGTMNVSSRYHYAGSIKVAMRTGSSTLNFLLSDHLGSNAITTSSSGVKNSEIRYMPWGTTMYTSGSSPTTMQYTGQRLESSLGLLFYNSRWYDPAAGRFIQADSIVPGGVQGQDRYAYSYNNPVKYTDPSGHKVCQWGDHDPQCNTYSDIDYQLDQQIQKPDDVCRNDKYCYQSYLRVL